MSTKSERTRQTILDAAWKRLSRGDPARLEDVAADAGVSRQAVYLHFQSRSGLLLALVEHIDERLGIRSSIAQSAAAKSPEDALIEGVRVAARYAVEIHSVAMALARLAETDEDARAALANRMKQRRRGIRAALRAVEERGALAPGWTTERATDALWASGSPQAIDLLLSRGWSAAEIEQWLVHVARSFCQR